jgi:hypothetical protein
MTIFIYSHSVRVLFFPMLHEDSPRSFPARTRFEEVTRRVDTAIHGMLHIIDSDVGGENNVDAIPALREICEGFRDDWTYIKGFLKQRSEDSPDNRDFLVNRDALRESRDELLEQVSILTENTRHSIEVISEVTVAQCPSPKRAGSSSGRVRKLSMKPAPKVDARTCWLKELRHSCMQ